MTTTALTTTDRALTTTDVMTAFGAFLRLYVAGGDASPETIRSYYGNMAQFVEAARLEGLRPVLATPTGGDRHGQPRYLYLIHPQTNGSRQREYIGTISPTGTCADMHVATQAVTTCLFFCRFADSPIR